MLAALTYSCPCSAAFVVACSSAAEDLRLEAEWHATVSTVAPKVGSRFIDGRVRGFACPSCGRLHIRAPLRQPALAGEARLN
jgi:hypothetical protein